jgi:CarD family transcriptional regulator
VAFKVGDKAVYAAHGIGEVTGIEKRELCGRKQKFYILRLLDSGMIVMVPMDASKNLRTIIPRSEVKKVLAVLKQQTVTVPKLTWNRRHRVYMDKLNSGSVYEVAEVLRELSLLRSKKELSFSERRVLETARSMLVRELALAKRVRESRIEKELDAIFG